MMMSIVYIIDDSVVPHCWEDPFRYVACMLARMRSVSKRLVLAAHTKISQCLVYCTVHFCDSSSPYNSAGKFCHCTAQSLLLGWQLAQIVQIQPVCSTHRTEAGLNSPLDTVTDTWCAPYPPKFKSKGFWRYSGTGSNVYMRLWFLANLKLKFHGVQVALKNHYRSKNSWIWIGKLFGLIRNLDILNGI